MKHILVHIRIFHDELEHDVWVNQKFKVESMLSKLEVLWMKGKYKYKHFIYLKEDGRILDKHKTLQENDVIDGDHLIVF